MTEKYFELNLNDEKSSLIAEVLGNKTCKRILNLLADFNELSENDIALKLKIPLNTVEYNLKKLLNSGFVIKASNFFWSVKGKRIPTYKLANKKIIISPRTSFKGIISSVLAGGLVLGGMKIFMNYKSINEVQAVALQNSLDKIYASAPVVTETVGVFSNNVTLFSNILIWVLAGLLIGALGYFIFKWLKGGFIK